MNQTPDQQAINDLIQRLRPKQAPKNAQSNGHATDPPGVSRPSDSEVLEKLFGEAGGQKWREVYGGNWGTYYDSQSSADAAIAHKLAFWTDRDADQVERIMQGSGLVRDKWNSRRGGSTWLGDEIARAIENTPEGYEWKKPHSRSHSLGSTGMRNEENHDLKQSIQALSFSGREKPGPRGWIVDNTIWEGHATSWFGEGGVAKSLLALHLGLTVAESSRSYWMAFAVKTVPVLYLDFELDADEQHRRALDLAAGMQLKAIPENFYYLSVAMMPPVQAFMLAAEECRRLGIGLVIVDSVGFALGGDSESAKDVLDFYRACIQPLKDAGASPLLIDHQAKIIKGEKYSDKQAFGSVYKTNAVRSSFQIRGDHEQSEITATFTHKKNNFGWKEKDFSLKVAFGKEKITVERLEEAVPNPDREPSKKDLVLRAVEELGRATAETVARHTGIDLKTVQNAFTELLRVGALGDTGTKQGRYRVVIPHSQPTKGTGTGTSEKEAVCSHGTPEGYPCDECDMDALFGDRV
jgi:hypothetical protein